MGEWVGDVGEEVQPKCSCLFMRSKYFVGDSNFCITVSTFLLSTNLALNFDISRSELNVFIVSLVLASYILYHLSWYRIETQWKNSFLISFRGLSVLVVQPSACTGGARDAQLHTCGHILIVSRTIIKPAGVALSQD